MKTKIITFEDYALAKIGNENKPYGEIFEIAWRRTDEYKMKQAKKQKAIKIFGLASCGIIFTWFSVMFSPSMIAHADVIGMNNLTKDAPALFEKLKSIKNMYIEYITLCGMKENHYVFIDMICKMLDTTEFNTFINAAEGLEVEEILNLISCL